MLTGDLQATFCATLVDEWVASGVREAVVAPGSRSTPMALAIAAEVNLTVHVVHDERVAAFTALGLGVATQRPPLLLCTSGTAAANFHPAVVEAGLSAIPMLVLTADRPPELRGVGAPQTIDQTRLFGTSVRWFHDPGVPAPGTSSTWRAMAARAFRAAIDGPVHLNLPFREPLVAGPGVLPPRHRTVAGGGAVAPSPPPPGRPVAALGAWRAERGVILAGGRSGVDPAGVNALAAATGWPVLADPASRCRDLPAAVTAFDAMLRHEGFATAHRPDLVVRVGRPAASKVLAQWVVASGAPVIQVGGPGVIDPDHNVALAVAAGDVPGLVDAFGGAASPRWRQEWQRASAAAEQAIDTVLCAHDVLTEPAVARLVARHRPPSADVVVASSMPVRDYEWYGGREAAGFANRGANGIDGTLSTALGHALAGRTVLALLGDIAFVHDAGALTAITARRVDLRIVVVDNDGGGIFSFLPQATSLAGGRFEQLFGTPHGTDVVRLAEAHGVPAATATVGSELVSRLAAPGPHVTRVATDRNANVAVHRAIHDAVAAAL